MGQCLVTKLKGVIDNENLSVLGTLVFKTKKITTPTAATQKIIIQVPSKQTCVVSVKGKDMLYDENFANELGKEVSVTNRYFTFCVSNGATVFISNKYALNVINTANSMVLESFNIDELAYSTGISNITISGSNILGNLKAIKNLSNINTLNLSYCTIAGNLTDLNGGSFLQRISTWRMYGIKGITGNINELDAMPKLTAISFTDSTSNISGSIEGFIENQMAKGVYNKSDVQLEVRNTNITYQGVRCSKNYRVSWTTSGQEPTITPV